jgi:Fur family zinc uptake transcriptional regulator
MKAVHHQVPNRRKLSHNQGQVLSCLRRAKAPLSAYAILDKVRVAGISHPPTVYRALNELIQLGMVHRLESRAAFVACDHGSCNGKAAFAICRECGKVVEISLSDEDERELLALTSRDIAAEQITLEIAGLCASCRPAKAT